MAYRRSTFRRGARRSRTFKRRTWRKFTRRYKRVRGPLTHSFKRTALLTPWNITSAVGQGMSYSFKLSDLSNSDEFTALFDQYRINAVKLQIVPTFTSNDIANELTMASIHSAIDHNDNNPPGALSDLMEYDTYKRSKMSRGHKRYFRVNLLTPLTASSSSTTWKKWINTASVGLNPGEAEYYGLKFWIDGITQTTEIAANFEVYATYYFQCKSVI